MFDDSYFFLFSQFSVSIALLLQVMSFQQNKREYILLFLLWTAFMMSLHYFFLFQNVAWLLNILACVRIIVAYFYSSEFLGELFLIINFALFAVFFSGYLDIFPLLIMSFATMWSFQSHEIRLRILFFLSIWCGFFFSYLIQSPVGLIFYLFAWISNLIGFRKYYAFHH